MDVLLYGIVGIGIGAALAFALYQVLNTTDRETEMSEAAGKLGLTYRPSADLAIRESLPRLSIFEYDEEGSVFNLLEGRRDGAAVLVFDYRMTVSPGPRLGGGMLGRRTGTGIEGWGSTEAERFHEEQKRYRYTTVVLLKGGGGMGDHTHGDWMIQYRGDWGAAFARPTRIWMAGRSKRWAGPAGVSEYVEEAIALIRAPGG